MLSRSQRRPRLTTRPPPVPQAGAAPRWDIAGRDATPATEPSGSDVSARSNREAPETASVGSHEAGPHAARSVAVLGAGHFTNDIYGSVLPAILPVVLPAMGLTVGAGGILIAANQVVSALLQPLIGHVADRRSIRWPIWLGVALSGLGTSLFGVVPNFWTLAAVVVLAGVGTAIFHPVSAASVGALAPPDSRGRWMGLYETTGWAGTVAGPLAVGFIIQRAGSGATWIIAIPALIGAALLVWAAPARPAIAPRATLARGTETAPLGFLGGFLGVATI